MKVAIVGATGETGQSIVNGLLESPAKFEITALVRAASLQKPASQKLQELGVRLVATDISGPRDTLVATLTSIDVKEDVLDHVKKIWLPFTAIDVGWWFQISTPRLPSGRFDYALSAPMDGIVDGGGVAIAITHLRDVGRYVARIISDDRTLNRSIFAYSEVKTQCQVFDAVEAKTGEAPERKMIPAEDVVSKANEAEQKVKAGSKEMSDLVSLWTWQYRLSWGVRGDNNPEYAKYLGYLDGKELYPDFEFTTFDQYLDELLEGKGSKVYAYYDSPTCIST
ncbi:isoflavone reductase [Emericellopsis atlantica]|uniref:Isoflavone reductase n=1 Tax=Emericellopsis atlantica TaxID=2614577 RepID=A0A9P8CNI9_9HYPO|nr:isoflavone reductase [Emericellopsis atlantica]KAG9251776.1 isoflavone reductase [Emericellopsis atlantica]